MSIRSKESIITARMTFKRKKEPMTTRRTQKVTAIQDIEASLRLYIRLDQPSKVIITKIVSMAHSKLLKFIRSYDISTSFYASSVYNKG